MIVARDVDSASVSPPQPIFQFKELEIDRVRYQKYKHSLNRKNEHKLRNNTNT